jgi:hypothetical protein
MHALPQLCFDSMKFGSEPLPRGGATDLKLPIPVPIPIVQIGQDSAYLVGGAGGYPGLIEAM